MILPPTLQPQTASSGPAPLANKQDEVPVHGKGGLHLGRP